MDHISIARADAPGRAGRRQDIQALRAFAVMAVVLYHLDVYALAGGFLGVDIFFVISGYLITRNILADVEAGTFSLLGFYARRFRRLFPASLVTILVTLLISAFILSTKDFRALGASALHALFSTSNILFWLETGYFNADAITKPLLHTWSLAAEEQFYLVWPAFALLLWRVGRRYMLPTIVAVGVLSLVTAQLLLPSHPDAVFYLMPFRIFEFCAGAMLVPLRSRLTSASSAALFGLGCAAMTASVFLLNSSVPMPGFASMLPVIGAMLCIYAGANVRQAIFPRPVTFIGDISYSLYLVHWPIVALFKYQVDPRLNVAEQTGVARVVACSRLAALPDGRESDAAARAVGGATTYPVPDGGRRHASVRQPVSVRQHLGERRLALARAAGDPRSNGQCRAASGGD